jgi:hypothetical protein
MNRSHNVFSASTTKVSIEGNPSKHRTNRDQINGSFLCPIFEQRFSFPRECQQGKADDN